MNKCDLKERSGFPRYMWLSLRLAISKKKSHDLTRGLQRPEIGPTKRKQASLTTKTVHLWHKNPLIQMCSAQLEVLQVMRSELSRHVTKMEIVVIMSRSVCVPLFGFLDKNECIEHACVLETLEAHENLDGI